MTSLSLYQKKIISILNNSVRGAFPVEVKLHTSSDDVSLHWHKHWELYLQSKNNNDNFDELIIVPPGEKHQGMSIEVMKNRLVLGIGKSLLDCSCFSNSVICSYQYTEEGDLVCSHLEQLERWLLCNAPAKLVNLHAKLFLSEMELLLSRSFAAEINPQCRSTLSIAVRYIRINYSRHDLTVSEVASHAGCSSEQLCRLFRKNYGVKAREYIMNIRLLAAMQLLRENEFVIERIASVTGWRSHSYFARVFKQKTGMTSTEFIQKCRELPDKEENYLQVISGNAPEFLDFVYLINSLRKE